MKLTRLGGFLVLPLACAVAAACVSEREEHAPAPTPVLGQSTAPIIGGKSDTTNTWVVGIDIGGTGLCSGSMIAPNLVLTARHCVSKTTTKIDCTPDGGISTNKVLGNWSASSFRVSTATDFRAGPSWYVNSVRYINDAATCPGDVACQICGYDLALLELKPSASGFPTAYKPPSNVAPKKYAYVALGYGCQNAEPACDPRGYRQILDPINVIDIQPRDFAIAGRVCGGDSGGPVYDKTFDRIYGALSRGDGPDGTSEGCNYGIYTRTDAHIDWLQKYGAIAAKNGGYAAPPWVTAPKPVPPPPDAGPPPVEAGPKTALGGTCTYPDDCESGICVDNGGVQRCSQACSDTAPCPGGFDCLGGYCWPAAPPPPDTGITADDVSSADADEPDATPKADETVKGTCTFRRTDGPPPRPQPWIVAGAVLVLGLVVRRKRR